MKKSAIIIIILSCVLFFSMTVSAAQTEPDSEDFFGESALQEEDFGGEDEPKEAADSVESSSSATGKFENMYALFQHWEAAGYPDSVGFVYSTDGSEGALTVLLVGDDGTAENQIRSMLISDSGLSFGTAKYSYNELNAVADEIISNDLVKNEAFHSVGVGWTSVDGKITGFGDSGKEPRVVVGMDQSVLSEYTERFEHLYGDRVVPEASEGVIRDDVALAEESGAGLSGWLLPVALLVGAGITVYIRAKLVPAMQLATGSVVSKPAPVSRKQVEEAVKNSEVSPGDEVFNSILQKIEKEDASRSV